MLAVGVNDIVTAIVKQELNKGSVGNSYDQEITKAMYIRFNCGLGVYEYDEIYSARKGLHLLYHKHEYSSYITVFAGITANPFAKINEVVWVHECHHDSCWRDIRTFSNVYFDMANEINEMLKADGHKTVAPKNMHQRTIFVPFYTMKEDSLYKWVDVKVIKDPGDEFGYQRLLEIV